MVSTVDQYYNKIEEYKNLTQEVLVKLYRSEDIATAYASATILGERMAEDFELNKEVKTIHLLEHDLSTFTEKRLHAWRHSFAALAMYTARLHYKGQDDTFPIPAEFLYRKKRKKEVNNVSLDRVFKNFLELSEAEGFCTYLKMHEHTQFADSKLLLAAFSKFIHTLEETISSNQEKLEEVQEKQNKTRETKKVIPQEAIDSIKLKIEELKEVSHNVKNVATFSEVKDIFKEHAQKTSVEEIFDNAVKTKDGFDGPTKDTWVAASILINLYPLYTAYGKDFDFRFILYHFIQQGKNDIGYIKNIPYFIYEAQKNSTSKGPTWTGDIEEEIHHIIKDNMLDCSNILHVGDFLHDFSSATSSHINYSQLIGELLDAPLEVLHPHSINKHDLENRIYILREKLFIDELEWENLPNDRREPHKTKRGLLLYEYFINAFIFRGSKSNSLSTRRKNVEKAILYIYRDLSFVMRKNNHITAFLLRHFKKALYEEQAAYTHIHQDSLETYFRISERRVFLTLKLLDISDWKGTIEKDVATILVTTIENFYEKLREFYRQQQAETIPDTHQNIQYITDYFKKAYRLLYYVFYKVKSLNLYEEMASFCTVRDEGSLYKRFLTHLGEKYDTDFSSFLTTKLIPPNHEKKRGEKETAFSHTRDGSLPEIRTMQLKNIDKLDDLRSAPFMQRFRELVKWKYFMEGVTRDKGWFFYQDYTENTSFFHEKEQESLIHSEAVFHRFSNIIWELNERFNLLGVNYTNETGYSIQYTAFKLSDFIQLTDILQETLQYLNELEIIITSEMPYKERELFLGCTAKPLHGGEKPTESNNTVAQEYSVCPHGINGLQSFLRHERISFFHLNNALKEGNEEKVVEILNDIPSDAHNTQKRRNVLSFLQKWFYQRFNFRRLLRDRGSRSQENPLKWGGKAHAVGRYIAGTASSFPFILSLIAFPFIIHIIDISISKYIYSAVVYGVILFFGFIPLHAILMIATRKYRRIDQKHSSTLHLADFFMPRILAIIFIAYSTMYFADEIWTLAITQRFLPGVTTIALMLALAYWILHYSIFREMSIKRRQKRRRILSIMAIGLFESFVINLFYGIFITSKMTHSTRADFETVFESFHIQANFHFPTNIILFSETFTIYPYLITLWTVQTFVIGVILNIFLEGRNIMENE